MGSGSGTLIKCVIKGKEREESDRSCAFVSIVLALEKNRGTRS